MNEYQNTGENCAFLQCRPWRRYSYVWISKIIRSSSSHMYYYLVVLKNLAKFTGTHLHRGFFSTCNLQLHRKRDAGTYSFLWVSRNFLGALLLWKTSCELILNGGFYEKWWTDILIIMKIYREVDNVFKKNRNCKGKCIFENIHSHRRSSQWLSLCIFYQVKELISCKYSI